MTASMMDFFYAISELFGGNARTTEHFLPVRQVKALAVNAGDLNRRLGCVHMPIEELADGSADGMLVAGKKNPGRQIEWMLPLCPVQGEDQQLKVGVAQPAAPLEQSTMTKNNGRKEREA